jgi:hypothetical protein
LKANPLHGNKETLRVGRLHHDRGAWHFDVHLHGNLPEDLLSLSMDVGVDTHKIRPWHFEEVQAIMKMKVQDPGESSL